MLVLLFPLSCPLMAQYIQISGTIIDEETNLPIDGVTVQYKHMGKTVLVASDKAGNYLISAPVNSNILLKASHLSYNNQSILVKIKNDNISENFILEPLNTTLGEVVVEGTARRVQQRNDTTVYFANAYKVNADATAYDLITQKLPGIGLRDGKLEAHGETVKEILIDGKEYFKSDISLSLKNLPADIINEIQVFDQVSDFSKLTGFDDGSRRKTINLVTKQGMNQSLFGKAYAGYGTENYYKIYGMFNWFRDDMKWSIFAQDNNTSEQNFSMIDLLSTTGSSMSTAPQQSPFSRGSSDNTFHPALSNDVSDLMVGGYSAGETTTHAIGTNFSDSWGHNENVAFSGHYMFNNADNNTDYDIRDDYYSEGSNPSIQVQHVNTNNTNHRFNTKLDWDISPKDHIMFRPSLLYQRQKENSDLIISEEGENDLDLTEMMNQNQYSIQNAISTSNELMYIHRFSDNGISLSGNIKYSFDNTDENLDLTLNNIQDRSINNQHTYSNNHSNNIAAVASYIQPIGKYSRLKVDAGWSVSYRQIKRKTERSDSVNIIMALDSVLSGKTRSDYGGLVAGISYLYNRRKTQFVIGTEFHSYTMFSKNDITSNTNVSNSFLPFLHIRHQWGSRNCQLHFMYQTNQTYPSLFQLQDAINNTNPTMSIRGNIELKPSYNHSATIRLLIPGKGNGGIFIFFVNGEFIQNYIANRRSIAGGALGAAESRSQILSYLNADGYYSGSTLIAYGFPFNLIRSNINISSLLRYSHIPGYWENEKSYNNQFNLNSSLTIGSNISKQIDFVVDFNLQYLNDHNANHPLLDVNYWTFSFGGQINWQFLPHFKLTAECGRTAYYGMDTHDFNAIIWNMSLAYKFLKYNRAEIMLSCDDILDQNNYFSQQTNELFRRKTIANVTGRRLMLTFTYNFNSYKSN